MVGYSPWGHKRVEHDLEAKQQQHLKNTLEYLQMNWFDFWDLLQNNMVGGMGNGGAQTKQEWPSVDDCWTWVVLPGDRVRGHYTILSLSV